MKLDEIDWVLIAAIIIGSIATVAREIVDFVGIDNLDYIILFAKLIAAFLTLVFAIWKFIRLKTFVIDLKQSDFQFQSKIENNNMGKATILSKHHKKGESPSFETFELKNDGSIESIVVGKSVDTNGNITLTVGNIPSDLVIRVLIKR